MINLKARRKLRVLHGLHGGEKIAWEMKPVLVPDPSVDQADPSITGTLAWHIVNAIAREVTVYAGTYKVLDDVIVPRTMTLKIKQGGVFNIAVGKTLTILGELVAGRYQIFSLTGGGVVEGLELSLPEWFGAAADATTDDRDTFHAAFQSLSSMGGRVVLDTRKQYYIASSLTMPKYTALVGNQGFSMIPREAHEWEDAGNVIYLAGTASITASEGCSITGFNIIRYGITMPADKAEVDNFIGTAIRLADHGHQIYIGHMGIVGFQWAIDNYNAGGGAVVTEKTDFNYCENLKVEYCAFDNTNNIRIGNSLSTVFWNNIKTGTLATVTLVGVATEDLERTGYSFHFAGESDGASIVGCTSYGYQNGFRIESGHAVSLTNCQADHPGTPVANSPVGYAIVSDESETVKLTGCHAWGGLEIGVYINNTTSSFQGTTTITGCTITTSNHNIHVIDGNVIVNGNLIRSGTSGIRCAADAGVVKVDGNVFWDCDYVISVDASFVDANLVYGENYCGHINTSWTDNWELPSFTVDDATPDVSNHKMWQTGDDDGLNITDFNGVLYAGKELLIIGGDGGNSTVKHDIAKINLVGGADFTLGDGDILHLMYDGTDWCEVSRANNTVA